MQTDPAPSPAPGWRRVAVALGVAGLACVAAACSHDGRAMRAPSPDQNLSIITTSTAAPDATDGESFDTGLPSLALESTVAASAPDSTAGSGTTAVIDSGPTTDFSITAPWADGGVIDAAYTCAGSDAAPTLQWSNVPVDTVELAVVVVDPDAQNFVHWVVAGINPGVTGIADGQIPAGAVQGLNGFGNVGWNGPCPPASESHVYRFEVHALSQASGLADGTPGDGMLRVIDGYTLEVAVNTGQYPGS